MDNFFKTLRFYYWLILAFFKKNFRLLVLSFILAFIFFIFLVNFSPFLNTFFLQKKEIIGRIDQLSVDNLPEEISRLISAPLLMTDNEGRLIPVLAKSWEMLEEGKIFRFYLQPNLFWSDGEEFTAFNIEMRLKDTQLKPKDAYIIEFQREKPLVIFPYYLTFPLIKYPLKGVGGLYKVVDYRVKDNYLKEIFLLPNQQNLPIKIFKFYRNEEELVMDYKRGKITQFETNRLSIVNFFSKWRNTKIVKTVDYHQVLTLFFNLRLKTFQEKEMRKAIAYLIPPLDNFGEKAVGPISPVSWAFNKNLKQYYYDFEKAKKIIEQYQEKNLSSVNFCTFYDYLSIAEEIKKRIEDCGLKVNLKVVATIPDDFDILLTIWRLPYDPDQYYFWHSSQPKGNITGYKNLKVDKLLEEGRRTIDKEKRKEIYQEFQKIIVEEIPALFLYYPFVYQIKRN